MERYQDREGQVQLPLPFPGPSHVPEHPVRHPEDIPGPAGNADGQLPGEMNNVISQKELTSQPKKKCIDICVSRKVRFSVFFFTLFSFLYSSCSQSVVGSILFQSITASTVFVMLAAALVGRAGGGRVHNSVSRESWVWNRNTSGTTIFLLLSLTYYCEM